MTPQQALRRHFGFVSFRPSQLAIIESILANNDTLAILPTGGGKSLCFQIPGLLLPGTTIVISPLISLMKDQVDALQSKNISTTYLNSSLTTQQLSRRLTKMEQGNYKFVYLAPERLNSLQFTKVCQQIKISLLVIDEAHCISMWGHDFRPPYRQIHNFISQLDHQPITAAFTATATSIVKQDIITNLQLKNPRVFMHSFSRHNLFFHVTTCHNSFAQELALFIILKQHPQQAGVIYTTTRQKSEYLAQLIKHYWGQKYPAAAYHAGLKNELRAQIQDQFLSNQLQLIVATNAFGMGVDKPNVRWVIHYQLPGNLENYYQEAGRAGRDGKAADCYLLFNPIDIQIQTMFVAQSSPQNDRLKQHRLHQLQAMINFAQSSKCRQQMILEYFGESAVTCGQCDHCRHTQLELNSTDHQYYHQLTQIQSQLPPLALYPKLNQLLAVHRPQTRAEFLKIPGIGVGWIEKWYNSVSNLLEKGTTDVHDASTTDC